MKKSLMIYDLGHLFHPRTRQDEMSEAVDVLEDYFSRQNPPITKDPAPMVFETMEQLTSDLSLVFETPYSNWSRDCTINKTFDLTCQCSRIGRYMKYNIVVWRYAKDDESGNPVGFIPIHGWSEMLPEKH